MNSETGSGFSPKMLLGFVWVTLSDWSESAPLKKTRYRCKDLFANVAAYHANSFKTESSMGSGRKIYIVMEQNDDEALFKGLIDTSSANCTPSRRDRLCGKKL